MTYRMIFIACAVQHTDTRMNSKGSIPLYNNNNTSDESQSNHHQSSIELTGITYLIFCNFSNVDHGIHFISSYSFSL